MRIDDFDYELPADRIAQTAIEPRDASRVLIARTLEELPFSEIGKLLAPADLLVVNRTRVRHARLFGSRVATGGHIEVLVTRRVDDCRWEAMVRPARRLAMGDRIAVSGRDVVLLTDPVDGVASIAFDPLEGVEEFIEEVGEVPLPPYFHGRLTDGERYQTVFADRTGSSAAPTAALHFTRDLVTRLHEHGVRFAEIELRIGLDTFRPMVGDTVEAHRIHSEDVVVGADAVSAVERARADGGRVIAVGTTVVRSLESAASGNGRIDVYDGPTSLFITPGYRPRVIDGLITNFHAPRTTLLVMIAALLGERWREIYRHASDRDFRFLSFGDAMFVDVVR